MNNKEIFAKNLTYYMELKGITQEELAEQLGITRQAVSVWQTGKGNPKMGKIDAICNYLGITREQLLLKRTDTLSLCEEDTILLEKIKRLSTEDRDIIESMVNRMLGV